MAVKTKAQLLAQVASLLADNSTGDISALDVRTCLNDIIDSASYGGKKVYKALLTQTGTNAPVATILENTLSGTPVWSYDAVGVYKLTLASEWTANKTAISFTPDRAGFYNVFWSDVNEIEMNVFTTGNVLTNGFLTEAFITIEVYP